MAKEVFFDSVRTAARFLLPVVAADNHYLNPDDLAKQLDRAAIWVTPKSVEGYDPCDFVDLPPLQQQELREAVEGFREIARKVPKDGPPTAAQLQEAKPLFLAIVRSVQDLVKEEWVRAVGELITAAERAAEHVGWDFKREDKKLSEWFFGRYIVPRLLIHLPEARMLIDPVAWLCPRRFGSDRHVQAAIV